MGFRPVDKHIEKKLNDHLSMLQVMTSYDDEYDVDDNDAMMMMIMMLLLLCSKHQVSSIASNRKKKRDYEKREKPIIGGSLISPHPSYQAICIDISFECITISCGDND